MRQDDLVLLSLTHGEEALQDVLLALTQKVKHYQKKALDENSIRYKVYIVNGLEVTNFVGVSLF